ncbi:hypothetical protein HK101_000813 [Irineochytrium annulatum]|nr:hypothetical protein HK101_000813 [Irineochytrium annulatum]
MQPQSLHDGYDLTGAPAGPPKATDITTVSTNAPPSAILSTPAVAGVTVAGAAVLLAVAIAGWCLLFARSRRRGREIKEVGGITSAVSTAVAAPSPLNTTTLVGLNGGGENALWTASNDGPAPRRVLAKAIPASSNPRSDRLLPDPVTSIAGSSDDVVILFPEKKSSLDPADWSAHDVASWLWEMGYGTELLRTFWENSVDGPVLLALTDEVMRGRLRIASEPARDLLSMQIGRLRRGSVARGTSGAFDGGLEPPPYQADVASI